jgi:NADH dehydrogenase
MRQMVLQNKVIAIIGGSGLLGRALVRRLANLGATLKVGVRHPQQAMHLLPMGTAGQIKIIPTTIRDPASVQHLVQNSDSIVNLVGILYEKGPQTFQALHVEGAATVAKAAKKIHAKQLIHASALGANLQAASYYARTKALGEQQVIKFFPGAHIIRPSLIFGPEDRFFNRFATLSCYSPCLPLIGHGKIQPVYSDDVAEAIVKIMTDKLPPSIYELAGPKVYTYAEALSLMLMIIQRKRWLVRIPLPLGYLIGCLGQWLPTPPLTVDQVRLLTTDAILSPTPEKTFKDLGITPAHLEAILPSYLARFRPVV